MIRFTLELYNQYSVAAGDQPFLVQKEDLIAELKMSKDITGIKKMKVERARVEEQQEKQMFTEITRQLTANSFVEKVWPPLVIRVHCWQY
jgi:uncharacterized protein YigA (DUF484 family)